MIKIRDSSSSRFHILPFEIIYHFVYNIYGGTITMNQFAKRLKYLRIERNLTQRELADLLFLERSTIAGYETKNKEPDLDTVIKIATILEVSTDYLLGLSDQSCK